MGDDPPDPPLGRLQKRKRGHDISSPSTVSESSVKECRSPSTLPVSLSSTGRSNDREPIEEAPDLRLLSLAPLSLVSPRTMMDDARPPSRRERVGLGERAVLGSAGGEGGSELLAGREGGLGDGQRVGRL